MNNQTIYWLWIQQAIGYSSNRISQILERYTFAEDFYRASFEDKLACGYFGRGDLSALKNLSLDKASAVIKRCEQCNIDVVTIGDINYPERLKNISDPPAALFVRGNTSVLSDDLSVAMVGTRSASPYGRKNAFDFAYNLARNGVTVVSGGALGIDTCSHRGALQAGGKTVCVLGCGLEYNYLRDNEPMRKEIAKYGAVVSEYPPDMPASKFTFPRRNRIISGLAKGVIVVEAGERSGSLITANLALEQNRDVFAVPGNAKNSVSFGTDKLIADGAMSCTSAYDILAEYNKRYVSDKMCSPPVKSEPITLFDFEENQTHITEKKAKKISKKKEKKKSNSDKLTEEKKFEEDKEKQDGALHKITDEELCDLSDNAKTVIRLFDESEIHIDTITEKSGLPIGAVHSAVTELEMFDFIESLQGRRYKLIRNYN